MHICFLLLPLSQRMNKYGFFSHSVCTLYELWICGQWKKNPVEKVFFSLIIAFFINRLSTFLWINKKNRRAWHSFSIQQVRIVNERLRSPFRYLSFFLWQTVFYPPHMVFPFFDKKDVLVNTVWKLVISVFLISNAKKKPYRDKKPPKRNASAANLPSGKCYLFLVRFS